MIFILFVLCTVYNMEGKGLVLIPVFNAEKEIENVIEEVLVGLKGLRKKYDILAIDDGSTDGTGHILEELSRKIPNLIVRRHKENMGLSEVLKHGYRYSVDSGYESTIRTDSDLEQDQKEIITKFGNGILRHSIVLGQRKFNLPKNSMEENLRAVTSRLINQSFGLRLYEPSACKIAFLRKPLERIIDMDFLKSYNKRWGFDLASTIIAKKLGYEIDYVNLRGFFRPERRPIDKVVSQYCTYFSIISELQDLEI